jgi:adenine/guanine phosphoribosyltransferase-like PRPP-binding protein
VACCEASGFVYTSVLASRVNIPLVLIREANKLPLLTVFVIKPLLYILSLVFNNLKEKRIKIKRDVVLRGTLVVVVDDMLSTRETLCTML